MSPAYADPVDYDKLEWQTSIIKVVSGSAFGRHLCMPSPETIDNLAEPSRKVLFQGIRQISAELSYKLKRATTPTGKFTSLIADITDSQLRLSKNHPLDGFIQLQQILKRMGKEPQGSALQLMEQLINRLRDKLCSRGHLSPYGNSPA